jgi:hypothetical protein
MQLRFEVAPCMLFAKQKKKFPEAAGYADEAKEELY